MPEGVFAGWAEQSGDYVTPVARAQFARVYDDSVLDHMKPGEPYEYLGQLDPEQVFYSLEMGEGVIAPVAVYDGIGKLLKYALGATTDAGAGPYTHTHTLASVLPANGMTYELAKKLPDAGFEAKILTGGHVQELSFEAAVNEELRIRAGVLGRKVDLGPESGAPTFPDYDNEIIRPHQVTVEIDSTTTPITGISFTLNNNLRNDRGFLGDSYIAEPIRAGKREITGEIAKEWEDKTLYDKFLAGSLANVVITGSLDANRSMVIELNAIRFLGEPTEETTEGQAIGQTLPFRAFYENTNGALRIIETNNSATT